MSFYHFAPALGYLRADLSGIRQPWDEIRMRHLAPRLGYNLRKTIVFTAATTHRIERLLDQVDRHGAEAVFVPGRHHLDGQLEVLREHVGVVIDLDDELRAGPRPRAPRAERGLSGVWKWITG
ncbi:hypothetical protein IU443_27975 [Nocardia farcinica]|uniref:Uncharacterized protein n=2 Tax=Nocardia farcinica TaxID=37329 RepID=Q5YYC3_NOCFA|nr:hypothetical protein [Nocardia farcinica]AXK85442.1 hypothetical protein DXT66_07175 [Nocardia farcinica]MBA4855902.1 hypothetical protein [Nocardia farcinica]MBC9818523.1 hypothetical protein [Nocardia farcinica]MBF6071337.1 hypothetical protein [Nocardia farcinica]MBF6143227.1 hypothetical protein [Nocardia farcinica]